MTEARDVAGLVSVACNVNARQVRGSRLSNNGPGIPDPH